MHGYWISIVDGWKNWDVYYELIMGTPIFLLPFYLISSVCSFHLSLQSFLSSSNPYIYYSFDVIILHLILSISISDFYFFFFLVNIHSLNSYSSPSYPFSLPQNFAPLFFPFSSAYYSPHFIHIIETFFSFTHPFSSYFHPPPTL